jgi:hypothetical protein
MDENKNFNSSNFAFEQKFAKMQRIFKEEEDDGMFDMVLDFKDSSNTDLSATIFSLQELLDKVLEGKGLREDFEAFIPPLAQWVLECLTRFQAPEFQEKLWFFKKEDRAFYQETEEALKSLSDALGEMLLFLEDDNREHLTSGIPKAQKAIAHLGRIQNKIKG